jgi:iron only hydrogenase large subunit-like protein/PAS domain-containing protein
MRSDPRQVVYTLMARCRDCHRCLRVCPVSAIGMADGQAAVDARRCIACGACIRECPQGAKTFRRDIDAAQALIDSGAPAAASLAPSFVAEFSGWQRGRVASALRQLGFAHVAETAVGAWYCAQETAAAMQPGGACVCTACPAVVNFVEKYRPDLAERLVPAASPMVAHARHIKAKLGRGARVVFIGPCVAKKTEAERPDASAVDVVLTFTELRDWLARRGIDLAACEDSGFDDTPAGQSRLFPLPGGLLKTAALEADPASPEHLMVSGPGPVKAALDALAAGLESGIEPLFCQDGCLGGPGFSETRNIYARRRELIAYNAEKAREGAAPRPAAGLQAGYAARPLERRSFTEEEIEGVFAATGKLDQEQRLNCGACGYDSCRDKAIAVLEGMAVPEMCIPLMRRMAEQRTDKIIATSPNGIVLLNSALQIISMNSAFRHMFLCTDELIGRPVSYLMDPEPFEKVASGAVEQFNAVTRHAKYSLVCRQIIYPLPQEGQVACILVSLDDSPSASAKAEALRDKTLSQAQQLLEHQISMAQHIAKYLGESTAHGEELVRKIMELGEADGRGG